ncbi:MAG TPA: pyridoxal-phosphate dependent enzyme [Ktedonobacterales bacterium]|nr:pyridoxal-phosphate dependent enzyme [Ktedonobacterales bacterium]
MTTADKPTSDPTTAGTAGVTRKAGNGAANLSTKRASHRANAGSNHVESQGGESPQLPQLPTIQDIWRAQEVIRPHVYHTPLLPSRTIGAKCGAKVYLKAENLQRSGAYKIRGATYKLSRLTPEERERGVIAASAGNHAQGVAIAAASLHIPCTIVMPANAPGQGHRNAGIWRPSCAPRSDLQRRVCACA